MHARREDLLVYAACRTKLLLLDDAPPSLAHRADSVGDGRVEVLEEGVALPPSPHHIMSASDKTRVQVGLGWAGGLV